MMPFFFIAYRAFLICGLILVALTLVALSTPSIRGRLQLLQMPVIWMFLAASGVVATMFIWPLTEALISSNPYVRSTFWNQAGGPYAWAYWILFAFALVPQLLWFGRFRRPPLSVLIIAVTAILPSAAQ